MLCVLQWFQRVKITEPSSQRKANLLWGILCKFRLAAGMKVAKLAGSMILRYCIRSRARIASTLGVHGEANGISSDRRSRGHRRSAHSCTGGGGRDDRLALPTQIRCPERLCLYPG